MESLPLEQPLRDDPSARPSLPPECIGTASLLPFKAANDTRMSQLVHTIEHEIIPRLMLAHRSAPAEPALLATLRRPGAEEVQLFARQLLLPDEDATFAAVSAWRARGVAVEDLYLHLLAPAARYLGDLWTEDLCSFTDVTVGLGRLQRVLRELSPSFGRSVDHPADGRSVLLLPAPGEQHTFGLVMVGEFFRAQGWSVSAGGPATADAGELVANEWFDVVGFSLGAEVHLEALAQCICLVKRTTCNPGLVVLVGGPLFTAQPIEVERVGAHGMATDGREAPLLAERLIARDSTSRAAQRSHGRP